MTSRRSKTVQLTAMANCSMVTRLQMPHMTWSLARVTPVCSARERRKQISGSNRDPSKQGLAWPLCLCRQPG